MDVVTLYYGQTICKVFVVKDTKSNKNILVLSNVINSEKNIVLYTHKKKHTHIETYCVTYSIIFRIIVHILPNLMLR